MFKNEQLTKAFWAKTTARTPWNKVSHYVGEAKVPVAWDRKIESDFEALEALIAGQYIVVRDTPAEAR